MTPMDELFQIRDYLITAYKRYERFIIPVLKFITIMIILLGISSTIGYSKVLTKTIIILIMALLGALSSVKLLMFELILLVSFHIGSVSIEVGVIAFLILFIIYLLFVRLYPKESLFIIGLLIAYKFHIPYVVPLIAGLFGSISAVVSLIIGTMIWYSVPQLIVMMQVKMEDLAGVLEALNANILAIQEIFKTDQKMMSTILILSIVFLTIYFIRKQSIDYAAYIAILVGSIMNIIGFVFSILLLKVDIGLTGLIISTIVCASIATIAQFFSVAVDYSRTETVQFEDEENYYYVKVVPKIIINKPKKQIKHIYTNSNEHSKSHES